MRKSKVILPMLLLLAASGCKPTKREEAREERQEKRQDERQEERREERQEERREQRRRHRHRHPQPPTRPQSPAVQFTGPWSGILDPSRAIDWTQAGARVDTVTGNGCTVTSTSCVVGIPTNRTQCGATIPASGNMDSTDANVINQRLQQCAATPNTYVLLAPGTFYLVGGITFGSRANVNGYTTVVNSVTLRGSGPDQTKLVPLDANAQECSPQASTICVTGDGETYNSSAIYYPYMGACSWTGPYTKGTTALTLANCVGPTTTGVVNQPGGMPAVGTHVFLDQRNYDIGLTGCTSTGTSATCTVSLAALPPGFVVSTPPACVGVGNVGGSPAANSYNAPMLYPRSATTCQAITAVSSNTFTYTMGSGASNLSPAGPCAASGLTYSQILNNPCGYATVDPGGIWTTAIPGVTSTDPLNIAALSGRTCPDQRNPPAPTCQSTEISYRSQFQIATVTSVTINPTPAGCSTSTPPSGCSGTITLDTPLYGVNWAASQAPGVWWYNVATAYHHDVGIESLTIDAFDDGGTAVNGTMLLRNCYNCWVRNVRSLAGSRDHIWGADGTSHLTVRDSYFYGTKRSSNRSYGVESSVYASDFLVENNIAQHVVAGVINGGQTANVESYNYIVDDGYNNVNWLMSGVDTSHAFTAWNLQEGNNHPGSSWDVNHGTSFGSTTFFRERLRGQNTPAKSNNMFTIIVGSFNRSNNIVGSVLGTAPGISSNYEYDATAGDGIQCPGPPNGCIYYLGQKVQSYPYINNDSLVKQTLLRWGNYDVVTGATRWCGTGAETGCGGQKEIPGADAFLPANAVPPNQTLPASFYLTSRPAFFTTKFGTPPFPPIGPDITGGNAPDGVAGMVNSIPAQLVFNNMTLDPAYTRTNTITSASWSQTNASDCGNPTTGNNPLVTLTGTFNLDPVDTFQISGAVPSAYNGIYAVYCSNGLNADYANLGPGNITAGGSLSGPINIGYTRVNSVGETSLSPVQRVTLASPCTTNCSINVPTLCSDYVNASNNCNNNGTGNGAAQKGTAYNVYAGPSVAGGTSGTATLLFCKQNATPVQLGQNFPFTTLITAGAGCIHPPAHNTIPATSVSYMLTTNPGSPTMTTVGTMSAPLIKTFNADTFYGMTPAPGAPPGITGRGKITGHGKIT